MTSNQSCTPTSQTGILKLDSARDNGVDCGIARMYQLFICV